MAECKDITWKQHIDNLTSEDVQSAHEAVMFYKGEQEALMEAHISRAFGGIKNWAKRGVEILTTNVTEMVIDRSALTYDKAPKRSVTVNDAVNEEATDTYRDLLDEGGFEPVADKADSYARLLGLSLVLVQAIADDETGKQELHYKILHRGCCDFKVDRKTGKITSLMCLNALPGMNGGKLYTLWDVNNVTDIEWVGDVRTGTGRIERREAHGYGCVPVAVLWDTPEPKGACWPGKVWQSLIAMNRRYNMFHIETGYNCTFQCYGMFVTNGEMEDGQVAGPDAILRVGATATGEGLFAEYRTPDVNLDKFLTWMELYSSSIAENYSVKIRMAGDGTATSGFQLVVEEIPALQTRADRIKAAKQFEKDLYDVHLKISNVVDLGLPADSKVAVEFQAPRVPVDEKQVHDIRKEELALGLITKAEIWREQNPDLTDDEIKAKEKLIAEEKAVKGPSFEDV